MAKYQNKSTLQYELDDFKGLLGVDGKYKDYRNLRKKVLEIIIKEINEHTSIEVNYKQLNKGMDISEPVLPIYLAAKQLLEEYYGASEKSGVINQFETHRKLVFSSLDKIVQASSLVETFNSILKPFINSTRGQVSQELLNLVKFYHNHRIFKRGKRQNSAPIELLTEIPLQKHWVDLLMDKIKRLLSNIWSFH